MTAPVPPAFVYLAKAEKLIHALPAGTQFANADIYAEMRKTGWPDMTEPRQFGPLMQRLCKQGVIEKAGLQATATRSHGGIASVWRRTTNTNGNANGQL
ncbi:hypothetical protein [Nocardia niwae]|uniref:hypothetical protein n=1 Tax=Nocardia niwae TaxID=626084 RepID=UPI0007A50361|nr:hypothetical protein [Nocardia niwae]